MSQHAFTPEDSSLVSAGFQREDINIGSIKESGRADGTLLNKLGTSIPTPFARLHLFDSAFREVTANHNLPADSNYLKLMSLALDMLEFIYLNGASQAMDVLKWNVMAQYQILSKSTNPKHVALIKALKSAWDNGNYADCQDIYLFVFNGIIIGGTSPLSLVFTNPNLKETFPGLEKDHRLFDSTKPLDLLSRSKEFRVYIYKLFTIYVNNGFGNLSIGRYISNCLNAEEDDVIDSINAFAARNADDRLDNLQRPTNDDQALVRLQCVGNDVDINGINIWVKDLTNVSFSSGYKIAATRDVYANYFYNGVIRNMKKPLVLNQEGISAHYVDGTYFTPNSIPESDASIAIYDRKLPGTQLKYPYLMADDIFQNSIIEVSYNIQRAKFYSGVEENTNFLLPLKPEFFKYFGPEDIEGRYKVEIKKDRFSRTESVKVSMRIPLENNRSIVLSKEYTEKAGNIVHALVNEDSFDLAFFPFFVDAGSNSRNEYDVMLVHTTEKASLQFYDSKLPDAPYQLNSNANQNLGLVTETKRSIGKPYNSVHYHVKKSFDMIEVEVKAGGKEGVGLVLPKMLKVDSTNPANTFIFGVDFGTTNTQIAYSVNNGPTKTFSITVGDGHDDEVQMVYLHDHSVDPHSRVHLTQFGNGMFSEIMTAAPREFLAPALEESQFPMRTAVCEIDNLENVNHVELFGSLNVGMNYSKEIDKATNHNRYQTQLKWDYTNPKSQDRVRVFFKELLLLMRNKSVLNGGGSNIKVVATYPQAMGGLAFSIFRNAWVDAANEIGLNNKNIDFRLESIAPYYSFSRTKGLNNYYVNMDIGGGSTDILYLDPREGGDALTYSVFFAANDIWGDGCNPLLQGGNNGFLRHYLNSPHYSSLQMDLKEKLRHVKERSNQSVDVINYLFANDKEYGFSKSLKGSKYMLLPLLHFTSLIWYMCHFAESHELKMPTTVSFTGMGSLYIKLISDQEDRIAEFANAVARKALEDDKLKKVNIMFAPSPKKVTAEGAVIINLANALNIKLIHPARAICYGIDDEDIDTSIVKNAVIEKKSSVLSIYKKMIDALKNDDSIQNIARDMGLDSALNAIPDIQTVLNIFNESYKAYQQLFMRDHASDPETMKVTESLFFWPLKDGLYQLGIDI